VTYARLLWLLCALALWAGAPAAAWGGPTAKVFPLAPPKPVPPALEGASERLTDAVSKLVGAEVADDSIRAAAAAASCSIDDSTCLDRIARTSRVKELVFGTIRLADDDRVFVKLTRYIAGTERREKTFVLAPGGPSALARQLSRAAREMFELPPLDDEPGKTGAPPADEPGRPKRRPARPDGDGDGDGPPRKAPRGTARDPSGEPVSRPKRRASRLDSELGGGGSDGGGGDSPSQPTDEPTGVRRGSITAGTYLLISGGVMAVAAGIGFEIAGSALKGDLANAKKTTPDDARRIAAIERAARLRTTTGTVLLVAGGLATAGGIVRALLQRRPIDATASSSSADSDGTVSLVPIVDSSGGSGAALLLSGRLPW
jgi:hypothetical protein